MSDEKEPNKNAECPLKRSWMVSARDLNSVLRNPSHVLCSRPGFWDSVLLFPKKELQCMNMYILWRSEECVTTGSISSICCHLGGCLWFDSTDSVSLSDLSVRSGGLFHLAFVAVCNRLWDDHEFIKSYKSCFSMGWKTEKQNTYNSKNYKCTSS